MCSSLYSATLVYGMASASPSISQDASSLRAAALLTLKSKGKPRYHLPSRVDRPSPDDASSVASTRRATPSPDLNYGSDDGIADAEGSTEEEELEGEKEEGEISDDDAGAAVKLSPQPMDIDDGPLPGLTSSSVGVKGVEVTGSQYRSHASPPATLAPTAPKAVMHSTSVDTNSAMPTSEAPIVISDQLSTTPIILTTASKPISSTVPAAGASTRSSDHSPITKLPISPLRASSTASRAPASISSDPASGHFSSRSRYRDANRKESDATANLEHSEDIRRASPPVFSQEANTNPSLSILPHMDSAHVRPSLNSELSIWFHHLDLPMNSIVSLSDSGRIYGG